MFPESLRLRLDRVVDDVVHWLLINFGDVFEAVSNTILVVLVVLERVLRGAPWWLVIIVFAAITFHASRRLWLTAIVILALFFIGLLGLWDNAMQTLALMLIATVLSVVIGIPIGISLSRGDRLRAVVLPILDLMQTIPIFVYLVPAVMLIGLGKVPAILATVIFAVPPVIRLTDLGIREVDSEVMEASRAFGASRRQQLYGVQIPLALPTIMAGINQTTMLAMSMVVIASMIGARGLGEQVLLSIQKLEVGAGAEAGLAIVALAIILDRITQAYGQRAQTTRRKGAG